MRLQAQAGFVLLALLTATITEAQTAPVQQQREHRRQLHEDTSGVKPSADVPQQTVSPSPEVPRAAMSLLDEPAKPAQVQLDAGKLSVKADNSSLSGILHDISTKTGMTVDGLSRDQRIFGNYGPAAPREVLSALVDGLDYNVMMVGALDNGAPRELSFTPRTVGGTSTNSHSMPMARPSNNDDEDDSSPDQSDTPLPPRPETNYPPEANRPQEPPTNGQPGQVKTPQQMLQELQQMRQLQQQQVNPQ
ncbi:MAG TPA: hypothetical protein VMA71_08365 [Alloacidobacterium sp.]|nr:hypothetical protein [Alloacidobacterium sp.]